MPLVVNGPLQLEVSEPKSVSVKAEFPLVKEGVKPSLLSSSTILSAALMLASPSFADAGDSVSRFA